MARSNPKPTDNTQVKAGRKKSYKAPPPLNREKQDRRALGEQQFYSLTRFTEEVQVMKFRDGRLTMSTRHVDVPYEYDETRKRIVHNTHWNPGPDGNGRAPR